MARVRRRGKDQRTLDPLDRLDLVLFTGTEYQARPERLEELREAWHEHGAELMAESPAPGRWDAALSAFGRPRRPVPDAFRDAWDD